VCVPTAFISFNLLLGSLNLKVIPTKLIQLIQVAPQSGRRAGQAALAECTMIQPSLSLSLSFFLSVAFSVRMLFTHHGPSHVRRTVVIFHYLSVELVLMPPVGTSALAHFGDLFPVVECVVLGRSDGSAVGTME
jgi:hypothetical protein